MEEQKKREDGKIPNQKNECNTKSVTCSEKFNGPHLL